MLCRLYFKLVGVLELMALCCVGLKRLHAMRHVFHAAKVALIGMLLPVVYADLLL